MDINLMSFSRSLISFTRLLAVSALIVCLPFRSHALLPESPLPSRTNQATVLPGALKSQAGPAPQAPTAQQIRITSDLKKSNITVQWDSQFNSPTCLQGDSLEEKPGTGQSRTTAVAKDNYAQRSIAIIQNYADLYGIRDPATELQPAGPEERDDLGFRHQRLAQVYRGVPVVGADLKVHFNAENKAYQVTGRLIPDLSLNTTPTIGPDQALAAALENYKKKGFADPEISEKPKLVIYALKAPARLAYQLRITSSSEATPKDYIYWIDSQANEIIDGLNQVCHFKTAVSGNLLLGEGGGFRSLDGWFEYGLYYLYDPIRCFDVGVGMEAAFTTMPVKINPFGTQAQETDTNFRSHLIWERLWIISNYLIID